MLISAIFTGVTKLVKVFSKPEEERRVQILQRERDQEKENFQLMKQLLKKREDTNEKIITELKECNERNIRRILKTSERNIIRIHNDNTRLVYILLAIIVGLFACLYCALNKINPYYSHY